MLKVQRRSSNKNDIFSGYLRCADCGSIMITRKAKDKEYYYCSNYTRNKKCTSHSINKDKFNRLVAEDCKINLKNIEKINLDKYIDTIYIEDKDNLKIIYKNK